MTIYLINLIMICIKHTNNISCNSSIVYSKWPYIVWPRIIIEPWCDILKIPKHNYQLTYIVTSDNTYNGLLTHILLILLEKSVKQHVACKSYIVLGLLIFPRQISPGNSFVCAWTPIYPHKKIKNKKNKKKTKKNKKNAYL